MADVATDVVRVASRKSIKLWVLLATVIAIAIVCIAALLIGDEVSTPAQYKEHGSEGDALVELAVSGILVACATIFVWVVFHWLVFRKRAKLWKSIVALALMLVAVCVVGVPARFGVLAFHFIQDRELLDETRAQSRQRIREIRQRLVPNLDGLRLDGGIPRFSGPRDIAAHIERIDQALARLRQYRQAVNAELSATRRVIAQLDIYEGEKEWALERYDERLGAETNTQRHLDLTEEILVKSKGLLEFLIANRNAWILDDGLIAFKDRATLERANHLLGELDEVGARLDNVQGALGLSVDGDRVDVDRPSGE